MTKRGALWTQAELVADLGTRMDDASDVRWTAAQKQLGILSAIRRARGLWWEERLDDTQTYSQDTFRYDLPPVCEAVNEVYFEALSDEKPRYFVAPQLWHLEERTLVFDTRVSHYDGQTIYILYRVYPTNVLDVTAADGVAASTAFSSATSTFVTSKVRPGDEVEIVGDSGGPYYVASITSETALVLHKAPTAGTELTFYVARYTDLPYEYLMYAAMSEMYEMASRNRPGVEVADNIRWASYYRQLSELKLRAQARHHAPQRRY